MRRSGNLVGRDAPCDVVLSHDSVSGEHARIYHDGTQWRVLNYLSTNGTFLNGRKVAEAQLRHGDTIRLGEVELKFQDSLTSQPAALYELAAGGAAVDEAGPQGTRVLDRAKLAQLLANGKQADREPRNIPPGTSLVPTAGGRALKLGRRAITIGRGPGANWVIEGDSVSQVHARLFRRDGRWQVMNSLSSNGTWVNGKKVTEASLNHGDRIRFGEVEYRFLQGETSQRGLVSAWHWLRERLARLLGS